MTLSENILAGSCNAGCPRFIKDRCPFRANEKDVCQRVREYCLQIRRKVATANDIESGDILSDGTLLHTLRERHLKGERLTDTDLRTILELTDHKKSDI